MTYISRRVKGILLFCRFDDESHNRAQQIDKVFVLTIGRYHLYLKLSKETWDL